MSGFDTRQDSDPDTDESVMFADNASFDGTQRGGILASDGQLWMGSGTGQSVRLGTIVGGSGVTVAYADIDPDQGKYTISLAGGSMAVDEFKVDVGANVVPNPATGEVIVTGSSIFSDGSVGNTLTLNVEATSNAIIYGQGSDTNVAEVTPVNSAVLVTTVTGVPILSSTMTDGQLIIGDTAGTPTVGSILSDDGSITITPSAGGIDLSVAAGDDAILTLTGDTGGALSPTSGNISILGGPGVTVTGSGSVLTVNSVVYTDRTASTLPVDSGTWATAAGAYLLPASPLVGELVEIVCITTGIVVTANTGQFIRLAGDITSSAGSATNSAKGDSLWLRYRDTDLTWYCVSSPSGVWVLA